MKTNFAKPVLYVLIGSACMPVLFGIGQLVAMLIGLPSAALIIDGRLGFVTIVGTLAFGAFATIMISFVLIAAHELGKWIMEKLL